MNGFALGLSCFALGFVIAQALYMRLLNRGHEREENYRRMLSASHQRYREISEMLADARRRRV